MCVVTGQHMVKEDWCLCPRSRMPALMSHYESYLQHEQVGTYDTYASRVGVVLAAAVRALQCCSAGSELNEILRGVRTSSVCRGCN